VDGAARSIPFRSPSRPVSEAGGVDTGARSKYTGTFLRRSRQVTILCSARVTQHHARPGVPLPLGSALCRRANHRRTRPPSTPVGDGLTGVGRELNRLRACGADDGTANRTPSAWMISPIIFLAQRQIVFFVWVTFGERKWSILAERRGFSSPLSPADRGGFAGDLHTGAAPRRGDCGALRENAVARQIQPPTTTYSRPGGPSATARIRYFLALLLVLFLLAAVRAVFRFSGCSA